MIQDIIHTNRRGAKKMPILFCHIAWMKNYAGRNKCDPPLGGGKFVEKERYANEECNFVRCDDGFVYGHFETKKGNKGRQVAIKRLGANKDEKSLEGVDIVWTAPKNGTGVKTVVGWYHNARLYRERQYSSRHCQVEQKLSLKSLDKMCST